MIKQKPDLRQIPLELLQAGRFQPRRVFDEQALDELALSIKAAGLLQPIVVRPIDKHHYEIIAGERRWRAAQRAELLDISCLVKNYTDEQAAQAAAIENLNRENLNPLEEAYAYQRMVDEFNYLHEEVAAAVGKSRAKVTNALRLLKLEPEVQEQLISGRLSAGHGRVLAGLSGSIQKELMQLCLSRNWSVRKLEQESAQIQMGKLVEKEMDPNLRALESALSQHLGSRVEIQYRDRKGSLNIDFHNIDILEGILAKIGFDCEKVL